MHRLNARSVRFWLFAALLVAAPLSKYPSVATPLFHFTSFRIGLYPLLALLFVAACVPQTIRSLPKLYNQSKNSVVSSIVLGVLCLLGVVSALYKARSLLLAASIILLIALLITTWSYVAYELRPKRYKPLLHALLVAGCIYGFISIIQFIFAGFSHQSAGICTNCSSQVFGFPRISGFAAEPQFHANALLIYFFVGLGAYYRLHSKLSLATAALSLIGIGLTFSRGAFLAVIVGTLLFFILLRAQGQLRLRVIAHHFAAFFIACIVVAVLFVGAASYRYRTTPDIAYKTFRSMIQQVSGGLIKLPESSTATGFQPAGLVQASSQDRLDAAHLSLKAWGSTPYTRLFGVGAGNLGPYVVRHISSSAPDNLTVYVFYILLLSELGIIGLGAFLVLSGSALKNYLQRFWNHKDAAIYTSLFCLGVAFLVQYCFFGSYINVPYIWLWFGILLGLGRKGVKAL